MSEKVIKNAQLAGANKDPYYQEVNHPTHYQGADGLEAIEVAEAFLTPEELRGAMKFNAMKYVLRAGKKPGQPGEKDCGKAEWYIKRLKTYFQKM